MNEKDNRFLLLIKLNGGIDRLTLSFCDLASVNTCSVVSASASIICVSSLNSWNLKVFIIWLWAIIWRELYMYYWQLLHLYSCSKEYCIHEKFLFGQSFRSIYLICSNCPHRDENDDLPQLCWNDIWQFCKLHIGYLVYVIVYNCGSTQIRSELRATKNVSHEAIKRLSLMKEWHL